MSSLLLMQLFVGRVAMLGFSAELIGEELTGRALTLLTLLLLSAYSSKLH